MEPDELILVDELAVFQALLGTEVPPLLLLRIVLPIRILRAGLAHLGERACPMRKELDLKGSTVPREVVGAGGAASLRRRARRVRRGVPYYHHRHRYRLVALNIYIYISVAPVAVGLA